MEITVYRLDRCGKVKRIACVSFQPKSIIVNKLEIKIRISFVSKYLVIEHGASRTEFMLLSSEQRQLQSKFELYLLIPFLSKLIIVSFTPHTIIFFHLQKSFTGVCLHISMYSSPIYNKHKICINRYV